jgi:transitional endoplasmic reticulum ATPase
MTNVRKAGKRGGGTAFDHLGGVDAARGRLIDGIVTPLKHPAAMARLGIRAAKGFLLYGPPGVGKSLLARVANAAEPQRNDQLINLLLAEIDQLAHSKSAIMIGATSRPQALEPSLLRPGRIDELVYVAVPDAVGRARILALQTAAVPLAPDVDIEKLADRMDRFTPADIEDAIRRAGLSAIKQNPRARRVAMADFDAVLAETRASVTEAMEKDYEKMQGEIKHNALKLTPMGFFGPGQLKPVRDSKHRNDERA